MALVPCSVTINTIMVLLLPFPPDVKNCTKELEKHMSFDALKNAKIHVQPITGPFSHLS